MHSKHSSIVRSRTYSKECYTHSIEITNTSNQNVLVVCRVRPENAHEREELGKHSSTLEEKVRLCVEFPGETQNEICVMTPSERLERGLDRHNFQFDWVFRCGSSQAEIFEKAGLPIIEGVLEGFNGTILAFGQTSSGKTHTMVGNPESEELKGVIPRIVDHLFAHIANSSEKIEFTVRAGMLEIYNERVHDLLNPVSDNLSIHEDRHHGVYVNGLTETSVGSHREVYKIMHIGDSNRAIAETKMNARSSRSHSLFVMTVVMNDTESLSCKTSKLYLVDLAGSEVVNKTGATGQTLEEAKSINKSLTVLGLVINKLTDGKSTHVPYRDSKLTRILQDSLGGNSKTCLIVTVSASGFNAIETLSTCRFGMRAKKMKNNAHVNRQVTVAELRLIVSKLEQELGVKAARILQLEELLMNNSRTWQNPDVVAQLCENFDTLATEESQEEKPKTIIMDSTSPDHSLSFFSPTAATNEDFDVIIDQLRKERQQNKKKIEKIKQLEEQYLNLIQEFLLQALRNIELNLIQNLFEWKQ